MSVSTHDRPGAETDPADDASAVATAVLTVARLGECADRLSDRELVRATSDMLALLQVSESATAALVAEAITRGLISDSTAADPRQWVLRLAAGEGIDDLLPSVVRVSRGPLVPEAGDDLDPGAATAAGLAEAERAAHALPSAAEEPSLPRPGMEPAQATRIAAVAQACCSSQHDVLARGVREHRVSVAAARTALLEAPKVVAVLPAATHDEVYGHFLALPPGSGARAIRTLTARVIATYADEAYLQRVDELTDAVESVAWSTLPGGMARLTADLAPAHAAAVRHAIDALCRPSPGHSCCENVFHRHDQGEPTGEPDARSAGKRRADALVLLIGAGAGAVDADGTVAPSGSARLVVTIGLETLTGMLRGSGLTDDGAVLTAAQARRLACDAALLPVVLGSRSEPLDVGREHRLVKPSLRAAVAHRDRHCTFPGCDRPPSWCEVHHVLPWHAGGETSLSNAALLCSRHHTVVHRYGYLAHVDGDGVFWDLRPEQMPHRQSHGSHAASCSKALKAGHEPP